MKKIFTICFVLIMIILAGCASEGEENSNVANENEQAEEEVAVTFRNLDMKVDGYTYKLTGEVQTTTDVFYTVEQGETILQEEEQLELEGSYGWTSFEMKGELPESVGESEEPPVVVLYGKSETEEQINPNYIPIDLSLTN